MILQDSNVGSNVTVINDKDGNLLMRITREYGEKLPTHEAITIEQGLLDLSRALHTQIEQQ